MKRLGIDPATGAGVEVEFGSTISAVRSSAAANGYLAPAFVDVQVNGFAGVDYNSPSTPHDEIARSIQAIYSTGCARFYPTVITGGPDDMAGALANLARAKESLEEGEAMDGFHVEGPHICPDDGPRGAHPRRWARPPSIDEYRRFQDAARGQVRLVTLSPEWPGAAAFIEAVVADGVVVSIGHTNATTDQLADAVAAGATMSTHIGNGAHATLRRHPNYIFDQLADDRLTASFIADGIHLGAAFLKVGLRAKSPARAVLVTDASSPAACEPGRYRLGEQEVDLTEDRRVVLAGQDRLAGSALEMHDGVTNLMRLGGLSLADAVWMASTGAARVGNVPGRKQGLAAGDRADFVEFQLEDGRVVVAATWMSGRQVYNGTK